MDKHSPPVENDVPHINKHTPPMDKHAPYIDKHSPPMDIGDLSLVEPESSFLLRDLHEVKVDISLLSGVPDGQTLASCRSLLLEASHTILSSNEDVTSLLTYGESGGDKRFLDNLSDLLAREYGDVVNSSQLLVTAGASHGLHVILSLLCQTSGPVFVEDPSYFYGIRVIKEDLQMQVVPVPSGKDGINTEVLDQLLTLHKPGAGLVTSVDRFWAAVYLLPVYSNPTGRNYSLECCKRLIQLARKHDVLLIADDVYNMLHFSDLNHAPPRLFSFDRCTDADFGRGHVISIGTFSKILAPGLRLGWLETSEQIISYLVKRGLLYSGGCFNHYTSMLVGAMLQSGGVRKHIERTRSMYKKRLDALCEFLDEHLPDGCFYQKPEGGFFLWLNFPEGFDALEFLHFLLKNHSVNFLPGICCSPTGSFSNCARLCFSSNNEDRILEGARRLCQAYHEFILNS